GLQRARRRELDEAQPDLGRRQGRTAHRLSPGTSDHADQRGGDRAAESARVLRPESDMEGNGYHGKAHDGSGGIMAWQWCHYAVWHQDRVNLLLHMASVPLFVAGLLAAARQAFFGEWFGASIAALLALLAIGVQSLGHLREVAR